MKSFIKSSINSINSSVALFPYFSGRRNPMGLFTWVHSYYFMVSFVIYEYIFSSDLSPVIPKTSNAMLILSKWLARSDFSNWFLVTPSYCLLYSSMFLNIGLQAARNLILDSAFRQLEKNGNFRSLCFWRYLNESDALLFRFLNRVSSPSLMLC